MGHGNKDRAGALPAAVARTGGGREIQEPQPDGAAFQSRTEDIMRLAKTLYALAREMACSGF